MQIGYRKLVKCFPKREQVEHFAKREQVKCKMPKDAKMKKTDGPTDQRTEGPTEQRINRRTRTLIEMCSRILKREQVKCFAKSKQVKCKMKQVPRGYIRYDYFVVNRF